MPITPRLPNGKHWARRGVWLVALVGTAIFIKLFLARGFVVTGDSMEETLLSGDWVLVNRAATGPGVYGLGWRLPGYSELERFDLVVIRVGRSDKPRSMVAKRIVGVPGDVLSMKDGSLRINGRSAERPHARSMAEGLRRSSRAMDWQLEHVTAEVDRAHYFPTLGNWGPLRLPPGHYFVLGDHRDHSLDSREFGLVPTKNVVGRIDRVLVSHDGSCCNPTSLLRGVRWERVNYDPMVQD